MDESKSDDGSGKVTTDSGAALPRRRFLGNVAKATGGLLLADLAASTAHAQTSGSAAPAVQSQKFTDWGWPLPYEQISAKVQAVAAEQRMVAAERRVDRRVVGPGNDRPCPADAETAGKARH